MDRRRAIYRFIEKYKAAHDGNGPTIRQIGAVIGDDTGPVSTSVVNFHMKKLIAEGKIKRGEGGIEIVGGRWFRPKWIERAREALEELL